MPVRDGDRIVFDPLECRWLMSALGIARDSLQTKAGNPSTDDADAYEYEQQSIRFDLLFDEISELSDAAHRESAQKFIEDFSQRGTSDG